MYLLHISSARICGSSIVFGVLFALVYSSTAHATNQKDRFFVEQSGKGRPVMVIPGLSSSPDVFKATFPSDLDLAVHWITLAGFGGTDAPSDFSSITEPAAAELADYLERENLSDVILIGHSMGGLISLLIAAEQPARVNSVLIVDSVPYLAGLMLPGSDPSQAGQRKAQMLSQFNAMSGDQFLAQMRQGLPLQATSVDSQALVYEGITRSDRRVVAIAAAEIFTTDYRRVLSKIDVKARVLVPHNAYSPGNQDQILKRYKDLYGGLKDVAFTIIEDSRHFIMLDQPDIFAKEIRAFINEEQI